MTYGQCWEVEIEGHTVAWFRDRAEALAFVTEVTTGAVNSITLKKVSVTVAVP